MIELKTISKKQYKGFNIWVQSYLDNGDILFQIKIFDSDDDSVTIDNHYVSKNRLEGIAKKYIDEFLIED